MIHGTNTHAKERERGNREQGEEREKSKNLRKRYGKEDFGNRHSRK